MSNSRSLRRRINGRPHDPRAFSVARKDKGVAVRGVESVSGGEDATTVGAQEDARTLELSVGRDLEAEKDTSTRNHDTSLTDEASTVEALAAASLPIMPWTALESHPDCPAWAVVNDETQELISCHDDEAGALEAIAQITAAELMAAPPSAPTTASANPLLTERAAAALDSLLAFHRQARVAAAVTAAPGDPGEPMVEDVADEMPEAETDAPSGLVAVIVPTGDAGSLVVEGGLPADELHVTLGYFGDAANADASTIDALNGWASMQPGTPFTATVSGVGILGKEDPPATVLFVEAPEFQSLRESITESMPEGALDSEHPGFIPHMTLGYGVDLPEAGIIGTTIEFGPVVVWGAEMATPEDAIAASAAPKAPPAAWFAQPTFSGVTPLTVTADGRVYGHAAAWDTCHIGMPGCTTAPRSKTDYAFFKTGEVITADGTPVSVGQITMGAGHAPLDMSPRQAAAHYDNVATAVCDVNAGEDEFGIWVAGALRPGVKPEQVHTLRASAVSGDWRWINGHHEMVGLLSVNVPGFPIPRKPLARVAAGDRVMALVGDFTAMPVAASGFAHPAYRRVADSIAASIGRDPATRRRQLASIVHPKES